MNETLGQDSGAIRATTEVDDRTLRASLAFLLIAISAWLWPFGVGGRMPVGGDVTNFSIGLMSELSRSLSDGRLPVWNANWGYGFAGVGESQMGVFYPPHVVLYGFLPTELAYTLSLVIHTFFGAVGAWWLAGRFGVSPWGRTLAGFAWSCSGFYVVHFPHQWGYTTGSWAPWALGLAWTLISGGRSKRILLLLAGVLALQTLPGHFQIAFETQVCILLMGVIGRFRNAPLLLFAFAFSALLAAAQIVPTWRLANLSRADRDWEYLSGFAATPLHLVSYVAPRFFHVSPLWRILAWDPFHTSPEELLTYVGIAPLFLACVATMMCFGRDRGVRTLAFLAAVTLVLSLGPYRPGFELSTRLPGFSLFRAPSRWGLATDLALAVLAGRGFDKIRELKRLGRWVAIFVLSAVLWTLAVVGVVELAFEAGRPSGSPLAKGLMSRFASLSPWREGNQLESILSKARAPQSDFRVLRSLARERSEAAKLERSRLESARFRVYQEELPHGLLALAALCPLVFIQKYKKIASVYICLASFGDLWFFGRERGVEAVPIGSLESMSPILAKLASESLGTRVASSLGNLPIVSNVAALKAYHTLDLPVMPEITSLASAPLPILGTNRVAEAMRIAGASVRVFDPFEVQMIERARKSGQDMPAYEIVEDKALAVWLYGGDWVKNSDQRACQFGYWKPGGRTTKAWILLEAGLSLGEKKPSLRAAASEDVIRLFQKAVPLETHSTQPDRIAIQIEGAPPNPHGCF